MDKNKQKDFARRISQANRTELIVVTYDIILEELRVAEDMLEQNMIAEYRSALKSAQRFLAELMRSLDYKYALAKQLMSLYEYVQRILVASDIGGCDKNLESAKKVISGLRNAYDTIAPSDVSGALMENSQSVYAGLTYGRGMLNETNLSEGGNRGFLA